MASWCFSGPAQNWKYGLNRAVWAANNDHSHAKWFGQMEKGDDVIIYITGGIGIVGFCKIVDKSSKEDLWWADEIENGKNLYPNVIYIGDISLIGDFSDVQSLRNLSMKNTEAKKFGFESSHYRGGVNAVKKKGVFDAIKHELLSRTNGNMFRYYKSSEENTNIDYIRKEISKSTEVRSEQLETVEIQDVSAKLSPDKVEKVVQLWRRNKWIIDERKQKTNNRCEIPNCAYKPFVKPSSEGYSEGHHIIPLGEEGSESRENIAILCPNHHREIHYGSRKEELTNILKSLKGL